RGSYLFEWSRYPCCGGCWIGEDSCVSRADDPKANKSTKSSDIDKLLVVTFTNAAAQEMRNRVGEALEKALNENPNSMHSKKQLSLLQKAPISTLHPFCLDVVKQYAYILDIDPG